MFNTTVKRIGFACKFSELNKKGEISSIPELNTGGTTLTFLKKAKREVAEQKMWDVMEKNITNTHNLVRRVSQLDPSLRMVRLTSDMMTGYTHQDWAYFYKQADVVRRMEQLFAPIGDLARREDVRLSFHPGQFTVLASETPSIVENSILEFEYHADMARMMGFGREFQDMKINVHISGRKGAQGIRDVHGRLSPEARNTLTIENEEMTHGLDDCLALSDLVPIVPDIHHHWIREGEYIQVGDPRIARVIDSWRGIRPVIHYSVSPESTLSDHCPRTLPDRRVLLESGHNKQTLRAHSDYYWNSAVNDWAITHWSWADMMCESKAKNLASFALYDTYKHARQTKETIL